MIDNAGPPLLRAAKIFDVFRTLLDNGVSAAAMQAILYIGIVSSEHESPTLPSGSDVARALGMSQSGTSRLLSNLLDESNQYIGSNRAINDGRSEAFFLTLRGKTFIESILGSVYIDHDGNRIHPLDMASYVKLKYIDQKGSFGLKPAKESSSGLVMTLEAVDDDTFDSIKQWMENNRSISKIQRSAGQLKVIFSSFGFAYLFMSRWGLKNRYLGQ